MPDGEETRRARRGDEEEKRGMGARGVREKLGTRKKSLPAERVGERQGEGNKKYLLEVIFVCCQGEKSEGRK